ncbi:MAG: YicC family protein [Hyphomicrobiaceae bacterium]|nr:YicC family protein [Hyphomicrobiaceae bacterium]
MSLNSMTGFSRSDGRHGQYSWAWEIRTVNGRGLDIRLRLPPGYDPLEQRVREACKAQLTRGNCTIALSLQRDASDVVARLNETMFRQVAEAAEKAREIADVAPPALDGLLSLRGVIEMVEEEEGEAETEARLEAVFVSFEAALEALRQARGEEGRHLAEVIGALVSEIEMLVGQIEQAPARTPEAIANRLREQVSRLLEEASSFDEQRLHQEAVLLAAKADVEEEIARLRAHVAAARDLLDAKEPVGRRFEFLAQEFNREANTICSKSNDTEITQAGLALKAAIDRLREQVQNIE